MPLNDAMRKYVFGPMGLTQTDGSKTPEVPEPALHTYSSEQREYLGIKPSLPFCPESTYWSPSWTTYDGALQTTDVTDMSKTMEAVGTGKSTLGFICGCTDRTRAGRFRPRRRRMRSVP